MNTSSFEAVFFEENKTKKMRKIKNILDWIIIIMLVIIFSPFLLILILSHWKDLQGPCPPPEE